MVPHGPVKLWCGTVRRRRCMVSSCVGIVRLGSAKAEYWRASSCVAWAELGAESVPLNSYGNARFGRGLVSLGVSIVERSVAMALSRIARAVYRNVTARQSRDSKGAVKTLQRYVRAKSGVACQRLGNALRSLG